MGMTKQYAVSRVKRSWKTLWLRKTHIHHIYTIYVAEDGSLLHAQMDEHIGSPKEGQ